MNPPTTPSAVTFDVYSALVDSRAGGSAAFARLQRRHVWHVDPEELFVDWDARNKELQACCDPFVPFRALARRAMADMCAQRGLPGDVDAATDALLSSMASWPAYPDVPEALEAVGRTHRVALLSNIDDDLLAATSVGSWTALRITSQQAGAYKPRAALYRCALDRLGGDLVHVPASARDVRGALEAGLDVIRVVRPGHRLDPDGPQPRREVHDLRDIVDLLTSQR
ncbi:MAG: haloacid dehalogenase [Euzebyales bacterium]|jgi:2-haloalkanoic acid dehalogenase type II|nr:haloacid dehalogenase [Euzebyales bacterium]